MRKKAIVLSFIAVLTAGIMFEGVTSSRAAASPVIPKGFSVNGVSLSGKTKEEAEVIVNDYFGIYDNVVFRLIAKGKEVEVSGAELGLHARNTDILDVALNYGQTGNPLQKYLTGKDLKAGRIKRDYQVYVAADYSKIYECLSGIKDEVDIEPVDGTLTRTSGGFSFVPGITGYSLDVNESAAGLTQYILNEWDGGNASYELSFDVTQPRGTAEELSAVKDVLGSGNTDYSTSGANRSANVANGARLINGKLLYPGDEFSVLSAVVPFTEKNGYQLAGSYEAGNTVQTYGGGICQVSTTLYAAVREAELEVVTRAAHSMKVTYSEPSLDAAISENGGKDFIIKNNKNYPVYIEGYTSNKKIYFTIYGKEERDPGHKVSYEYEILEEIPKETVFEEDASQAVGYVAVTNSGHDGMVARCWKIVTENGEETLRKVYNNSKYSVSNRVVVVGTKGDAAAVGKLRQAIAAGDEATVKSVAASLKPAAN